MAFKSSTTSERTRLIQKRVLQLRRDGVSFPQIAEELGMTHGYIYSVYKKALKAIIFEDVESYRKLELQKIEALEHEVVKVLHAFHPYINDGRVVRDTKDNPDGTPVMDESGNVVTYKLQDLAPKLSAVDRAVKLMERRAKLLGLDAPTKVAPTNPNGDQPYATFIQALPQDETL